MEIVYLGLFGKILSFVLNKIFQPVFSFLASLLNSLFTWLFNNVLMPILLPLLKDVFKWALNVVMEVLGSVFYFIFATLLKLIDYMQMAFDVFIGLTNVKYMVGETVVAEGPLLEVLMQNNVIKSAFWLLTLAGLGIALMFTIFGTAKSAFDLDFENKRPVSKVLSAMFRTFIQFFMVPVSMFLLMRLSILILSTAITALTPQNSENATLGRTLFVIASLDAARNPEYNVSTSTNENLGIEDKLRSDYYNGKKDYMDMDQVGGDKGDFNYGKFDYLVGLLVGLFLVIILAVCLVIFVQRIFEVLLLYVASPYFVATIPLDDGEKFGQWKEMMVAKCFSGFGTAIGMRIYLLLCPLIVSGQISLTAHNTSLSSPEASYMIKLVFLLGGAWAVFKSGSILTSILNYQAGMAEQQAGGMAAGFLYGHMTGAAMSGLSRLKGSKKGDGGEGKGEGKDNSGTFKSAKPYNQTQWKKATPSKDLPQRGAAQRSGTQRGPVIGGARAAQKKGDGKGQWTKGATPKDMPQKGVSKGVMLGGDRALKHKAEQDKADKVAARGKGQVLSVGRLGIGINKDGKKRLTANFGSLLSNRYDSKGNQKVRFMGMGYTKDSNGKITAMKFPMVKKQLNEKTGKMDVTKVSLGKIATFRADTQTGKLSFTDCNLLGYHATKSEDGLQHTKMLRGALSVTNSGEGVENIKLGGINFNVGKLKGTKLGRGEK